MKSTIFMGLLLFFLGCSKPPKDVPNANLMPPPFDFVLIDNSGNAFF